MRAKIFVWTVLFFVLCSSAYGLVWFKSFDYYDNRYSQDFGGNSTSDVVAALVGENVVMNSLNISNNVNVSGNLTVEVIIFGSEDHTLSVGSDVFNGLSETSFVLHHAEEHAEGEIVLVVSQRNKTILFLQVGKNNSAGLWGNSFMLMANTYAEQQGFNLTKASDCLETYDFFNRTIRVDCDTEGHGASGIVQGSWDIWRNLFIGEGIRGEGTAFFEMQGNDFDIINGTLHVRTPRREQIGLNIGELADVFSEDFDDGTIDPFVNTVVLDWVTESNILCNEGECANSEGGGGTKEMRASNIGTSNFNTLNLTFYRSNTGNGAGGDSFRVFVNNNSGSGDVSIWNETSFPVTNTFVNLNFPPGFENTSNVSIGVNWTGTNSGEVAWIDEITIIGLSDISTLQNVTRFDTNFLLGDGSQRIFWNGTTKVLELPGNTSFGDVTQNTLNVTVAIFLNGSPVFDWSELINTTSDIQNAQLTNSTKEIINALRDEYVVLWVQANNATDIEATYDLCTSGNCLIRIPCGTYNLPTDEGDINMDKDNTTIIGSGDCTIINYYGTLRVFYILDVHNTEIGNLVINLNTSGPNQQSGLPHFAEPFGVGYGIATLTSALINFTATGIYIHDVKISGGAKGINLGGVDHHNVSDVLIENVYINSRNGISVLGEHIKIDKFTLVGVGNYTVGNSSEYGEGIELNTRGARYATISNGDCSNFGEQCLDINMDYVTVSNVNIQGIPSGVSNKTNECITVAEADWVTITNVILGNCFTTALNVKSQADFGTYSNIIIKDSGTGLWLNSADHNSFKGIIISDITLGLNVSDVRNGFNTFDNILIIGATTPFILGTNLTNVFQINGAYRNQLLVQGTADQVTYGSNRIRFNRTGSDSYFDQTGGRAMVFRTGLNNEFVNLNLEPNGRVGINDTSPDFKFEITGFAGKGWFGITDSVDGDIFVVGRDGEVNMSAAYISTNLGVVGTLNSSRVNTSELWIDSVVKRQLVSTSSRSVNVCSSGCSYTTIQAAVNAIPYINLHYFSISIKDGTYDENVIVPPIWGVLATTDRNEGVPISIVGNQTDPSGVKIKSMYVSSVVGAMSLTLSGMRFTGNTSPVDNERVGLAVYGSGANSVGLDRLQFANDSGNAVNGMVIYDSKVVMNNITFIPGEIKGYAIATKKNAIARIEGGGAFGHVGGNVFVTNSGGRIEFSSWSTTLTGNVLVNIAGTGGIVHDYATDMMWGIGGFQQDILVNGTANASTFYSDFYRGKSSPTLSYVDFDDDRALANNMVSLNAAGDYNVLLDTNNNSATAAYRIWKDSTNPDVAVNLFTLWENGKAVFSGSVNASVFWQNSNSVVDVSGATMEGNFNMDGFNVTFVDVYGYRSPNGSVFFTCANNSGAIINDQPGGDCG